ncbi:MAG: hypothetical protein K0B84_11725 [Firmicutes bacterium]|nr:hypothetical protein [Bacillota bacterium]
MATKEEIRVLYNAISGELAIPALLKPVANLVIPGLIDGLDNKVGDRIPEPWQTHCENLVTMVVKALEDKVITQEEVTQVMEYAAKVADEKIDIPLLGDDTEAIVFIELFRLLGVLLYSGFSKKKAA